MFLNQSWELGRDAFAVVQPGVCRRQPTGDTPAVPCAAQRGNNSCVFKKRFAFIGPAERSRSVKCPKGLVYLIPVGRKGAHDGAWAWVGKEERGMRPALLPPATGQVPALPGAGPPRSQEEGRGPVSEARRAEQENAL